MGRVLHFGLSPLAQGTPARLIGTTAPARFIPAGAGNTLDGYSRIKAVSVYPRWRGEHKLAV